MCEWLSCREWCDVRLLCGGRSFSAHRAVLASASTFLRKLLLSCPEDSPTFIVLPEFDLEAVSSVLYYVYNGEVTIQKTKMKMFLDIIKEMQIFIDGKYLQEIRKGNIDCTDILQSESFKSSENLLFKKDSPFEIDNVTKDEMFDVEGQCELIVRENHILHHDITKPSISVNNMQSTDADRQRNSFLRDLFTETYPRNGNINGCAGAAGVLAISNERYLAPTSVLSTNANGKQLGDETLPSSFGMALTSPSAAVCYPWKWRQFENKGCTDSQSKNFTFNNKLQMLPNIGCDYSLFNYCPELTLKAGNLCKIGNSRIDQMEVRNKTVLGLKENKIRVAVLNKVMDSPWCSRVPNNFKPFRRKNQDKRSHNLKIENIYMPNKESNDTNNNIPTPKLIGDTTFDTTSSTAETSSSLLNEKFADKIENKCSTCSEVFPSTEVLNSHKKVHLGRYSCDQCSKTFSQLRNYKYHMSVHRGTREFAATCPVCGKYFNDRGYLSSHMKIHRNRKEYKCSQCPKSFNQRVAYNMHVRIHTGVKPHVCEQCGKAFSRKMLLKQHLRTHSGERPYACAHCDKRFADRSNMTLHLRLHTGVKPFSCPMCPKAFTKKHHLKSHLNFHTGAKPYSCPRCKLAFTQSSNMRTHFKKCTVELNPQ